MNANARSRTTPVLMVDELPHGIDLLVPQRLEVRIFRQLIEREPDLVIDGRPRLLVLAPCFSAS